MVLSTPGANRDSLVSDYSISSWWELGIRALGCFYSQKIRIVDVQMLAKFHKHFLRRQLLRDIFNLVPNVATQKKKSQKLDALHIPVTKNLTPFLQTPPLMCQSLLACHLDMPQTSPCPCSAQKKRVSPERKVVHFVPYLQEWWTWEYLELLTWRLMKHLWRKGGSIWLLFTCAFGVGLWQFQPKLAQTERQNRPAKCKLLRMTR